MLLRRDVFSLLALGATSGCATAGAARRAAPPRTPQKVFQRRPALVEAPFGSDVSAAIVNYTRVAPYAALAGVLGLGGLAQAQAHGFQLVVDLRGDDEAGVAEEVVRAASLGLAHRRAPMPKGEAAWETVAMIERLLDETANFAALIHCASANRAAALWALLRARAGVDPVTAIEEARAAGLTSREAQVRALLGLA